MRLMMWTAPTLIALGIVFAVRPVEARLTTQRQKQVIAHRGSSAYAPEHTLAAYRMALQQSADFVEQDLQVTRDGVLVCMHDETLDRTTNVEEVYPDRFVQNAAGVKRWYVADFTLDEIRKLDAGSWFDPKYAGERIPTFQEAVDLVRGKAGLYPETKSPEMYIARGLAMEDLLATALERHGLPDRSTPVVIQSFSEASLRKMAQRLKSAVPLVLLTGAPDDPRLTSSGLRQLLPVIAGIGPSKETLLRRQDLVRLAHDAGLTVTPYTFRSSNTGMFPDVRAEMRFFLDELGVDALFTDNPDLFPR